MISRKKLISTYLISFVLAISSAYTPCCDFSTSDCGFASVSWETAPPDPSNTSLYPYFISTRPDSNYIYLQDKSGTVSFNSTYDIFTVGDTVYFNYYYSTIDPIENTYLQVYFINALTSIRTLVADITVITDVWTLYTITCDSSVNYCCGSQEEVPCSGTFDVIGSLDVRHDTGLFAVDGFGCGNTPSTTTQPYTLPPPVPTECIDFETDVGGITAEVWFWSKINYPYSYSIPPFDGYYLWTDFNAATATTSTQTAIYPGTTFSMSYFISGSGAHLEIYFIQDGYTPRLINTLPYSGTDEWIHTNLIDSTPLCLDGVYPCQGYFWITSYILFTGDVVAIDNVGRDGHCHDSFPCCYFEDPFFCGFTPYCPTPAGCPANVEWRLFPTYVPVHAPPPPPSATYVYLETVNYIGNAFTSVLSSPTLYVDYDVTFRGNFYCETPDGFAGLQSLELNFLNSDGVGTKMDFLRSTSGNWMEYTFSCFTPRGDCCQGQASCTGRLELTAVIQTSGGSVLYAIDAIEINDNCMAFPGLFMKSGSGNETSVPLHFK